MSYPKSKNPSFTAIQNDVIRFIKEQQARRQKMVSDLVTSLIRTAVPMVVSAVVTALVSAGISVPQTVQDWVSSVLFFVFAFAYYAIVRLLEGKYKNLGWLLGSPVKPTYNK